MPASVHKIILTFPPRPLSPWERALITEWAGRASDVHRAFVSERRGDDPKILGRVVVLLWSSPDPAFLVHSAAELPFWIVMAAPAWDEVRRFPTLRAALNWIQPVLDEPGTGGEEFFSNLSELAKSSSR